MIVENISTTTQQGATQDKTQTATTNYYNLDAIISVGYRVNSIQATKFRIWATGILKEYMIKGFAMDDERLKQGKTAFGKDYFRELLERVRSIRASERRIWQQITDIFAECSIDYDKNSDVTYRFYATIITSFIMQSQEEQILRLLKIIWMKSRFVNWNVQLPDILII